MTYTSKQSGIELIGDIPAEWEVKPIKYCVDINKSVLVESTPPSYQFRYIDIGSVTFADGITGYEETTFENAPSRARRIVHKGDTIVSTVRTYLKAIARITDDDNVIASTGFVVLTPTHIDDGFLEFFCKSDAFCEEIDKQSSGIAYPAVNSSQVGRVYVPLPPLTEQRAIAAFLDDRCGYIDGIVADLERQLEILRQYKKALITEKVTKGLDKSAPMKESGIDWIGSVPSNWEIKKIKYLFSLRDEKNYLPLEEVNLISLYTDLGVVQHDDLEKTSGNKAYTADGYRKVFPDDIIVNIILCWMGAIGISDYEGVTSPAYDVYKPLNDKTLSKYYHYLFRTSGFNMACFLVGRGIMAMRWRTYSSEFMSLKVAAPPIKEQRAIVDYLDGKCAEIDAIITEKQRSVETMRQYKRSLIYEYITGKKRVVS